MNPTPEKGRTRAAVCAGLSFAACVLAAAASFGSRAGAQQVDKPVEQVRKNIQVIKGLPESQILPLMNFVSTSLGVRCNYCHVVRQTLKVGGPTPTMVDTWFSVTRRLTEVRHSVPVEDSVFKMPVAPRD
ncbi:MAG: photosynthetic reaction center cytochrome c subunit family protein [Acidobacteriota bacterium]|nr:photosynthetic reaction center cytochrome c subunit family protein [Acidobacteriota bacterium]